ncbi:hypothetical protein FDK38_000969 [Candidozyma auris]|nr:hypothetical protein FDK38_000969 [[Candida] auris]
MSDTVAKLAAIRKQRDSKKSNDAVDEINFTKVEFDTSSVPERDEPQKEPSNMFEGTELSKHLVREDEQHRSSTKNATSDGHGYNSDLKADIAAYLAKAERGTERAIYRLIYEKYQKDTHG